MEFIGFLLIGLVAGWLTGKIARGEGFGLFGNLIVGVMGSFVGAFLFGLLRLQVTGWLGRFVMAVIGSAVFLILISFLKIHGRSRKAAKKED
jgi:uncharacterized membrane protein YeaQ/YmgE (transglycosylase-associated protein family)